MAGLIVLGFLGAWLFAAGALDKAEKNLREGIYKGDVAKVKEAVNLIAQTNTAKALEILLKSLQSLSPDKPEIYWGVLKGLDSFTDQEAVKDLTDFILKNKNSPLGRDALFILKSNTSPSLVKLLTEVIEDGTDELRAIALDHLAEIRDKASVEALIALLKDLKSKEFLKKKVIGALIDLTGQNLGEDIEAWMRWWGENKDKPDILSKESSGGNTGTAVDHMGYARLGSYKGIKELPKDKILVITGECKGHMDHFKQTPEQSRHDYDRIEKILERMEIPHTCVSKIEFNKDSYTIPKGVLVLIFNCNHWREHCCCPECAKRGGGAAGPRSIQCPPDCVHYPFSGKLSDKTMKRIEGFLEAGGYIFSEDWELEEVLERVKPNNLSHSKLYDNNFKIKILPAPGATNHPYLRGVFEAPTPVAGGSPDEGTRAMKKELRIGEAEWKIDKDSPDIVVKNPKDVTVLIISPDLKKDGAAGAVAVTYACGNKGGTAKITGTGETVQGGGRVLHVLSHFGKQGNPADEYILQNLILNFLMEAAGRAPKEAFKK